MTTEMIGFAIVGVAFVIFLAVLLVLGLVGLVKALRRKPEPPPAQARPVMASFAEPLRRPEPAPSQPSADFLSMAMAYSENRDREEKVRAMKETLDKVAFLATKIGPSSPPPNA